MSGSAATGPHGVGVVAAALFAHQGGWDEIMLIAGPIVLISGLLLLAKRRVDSRVDSPVDSPADQPDSGERVDQID